MPPKRNWIKDAPTLDEQIRRRAIVRANAKKHTQMRRAAYSLYRQLVGEYGKSTTPSVPKNCVVCGIELTGGHRKMCGSRSCHAARAKLSRQLIAEGKRSTTSKPRPKLPTQPCAICGTQTHAKTGICNKSRPCRLASQYERNRLIADGSWVSGCRFHPLRQPKCIVCNNTLYRPKTRYCPPCKELRIKEHSKRKRTSKSRKGRTQNENLTYQAMRELGLIPQEIKT